MQNEDESSDPLPFQQLHRSVIPLAASLARATGITHNEAIGGLVQFWFRAGDPRELEALVRRGVMKVVLDLETLNRRLRLAFGREFDPADLVEAQVLAPDGPGWRIRGMSRQLGVIHERLVASLKGKAGGEASVKSRRRTNGTAQPTPPGPARSGSGSNPAPSAPPPPEADAEPGPNPPRSSAEAEERVDSGESTDQSERVAGSSSKKGPKKRQPSAEEECYSQIEAVRVERCRELGIDAGEQKTRKPARINELLLKAVEHCGYTDRITRAGVLTRWDQFADLFEFFLTREWGQKKDPPWAIEFFCFSTVLDRLMRERAKADDTDDQEATAP